jgi:hypothetical protein
MAVTSDGKTEARANVSKGNIFLPKRKKSWKTCRHLNTIGEEESEWGFTFFFYFQYIHDDESVCT